jgi:phosphonate transport system permease protein
VTALLEGLRSVEDDPRELGPGRARTRPRARRLLALAVAGAVVWSLVGAGVGRTPLVNPAGWPQVAAFVTAAASPELDPAFLRVVVDAAQVTLAYAVLATALSLALGVLGAAAVSATTWRGRRGGRTGWLAGRVLLALPRGVHEAVWALLLVNVLGLDPLVAVLAIALPFGAITAKVYADLLDEVPRGPYDALRAAGASRSSAALHALLPAAGPDLLSYAFYRFECSVRSAVVLGVVGAGGLGFELALSFSALRYGEMWTLIAALVVLCAGADLAGSALRSRLSQPRPRSALDAAGRPRLVRQPAVPVALAVAAALVLAAWQALDVRPSTLWSDRSRASAADVAARAWPPASDPETLVSLWHLSVQTFSMSLLAMVLATGAGLAASVLAARVRPARPGRRAVELAVRALLLLARAVPPPVWALLVLFVLTPGPLAGAVALAAYNAGVLGRLMAEAQESLPPGPRRAVEAVGASPVASWSYAVLPRVLPKDVAYGLYRWEVAARDTVVVGLVGAGGLGSLLARQSAAFDWPGLLATVLALSAVTLAVDLLSTLARRICR